MNLWFIKEIGLEDHLSPQRATGLSAMIDTIKKYAITAVHAQH
ncbi:SufE family protein [Bacillus albus]